MTSILVAGVAAEAKAETRLAEQRRGALHQRDDGGIADCETRDAQGRTSARTTCWPQGTTGQTCQTQEYPNGDRPQS